MDFERLMEFYVETDREKKTIVIGKDSARIALTFEQAGRLVATITRQIQ